MPSPFAQLNPGDSVIQLAKTAAKFSLLGLGVGAIALVYFVVTDSGTAAVMGGLSMFFGAVIGAVIGFVGFICAAGARKVVGPRAGRSIRLICAVSSALAGAVVLALLSSSMWSPTVFVWLGASFALLVVAFYFLTPRSDY